MSNLLYANTRPKKIAYNGSQVKKVLYNNVVVWMDELQAGETTIKFEAIPDKTQSQVLREGIQNTCFIQAKTFNIPFGCTKIYVESNSEKFYIAIQSADKITFSVAACYAITGKARVLCRNIYYNTQTSHTENIPYALINQLELNVESHSRTLLCTQTTHPKSGQIVQESFQERFDQQDF